jgi:hypothetical protein
MKLKMLDPKKDGGVITVIGMTIIVSLIFDFIYGETPQKIAIGLDMKMHVESVSFLEKIHYFFSFGRIIEACIAIMLIVGGGILLSQAGVRFRDVR